MKKYKINRIIQNHTLTNTEIPYMSDLGLRFVNMDVLVNAMLHMNMISKIKWPSFTTPFFKYIHLQVL